MEIIHTIFGFTHHFVSYFCVDIIVAKFPGMCRTVLYNLIMSLSCKYVVFVQEELYQMLTPREGFFLCCGRYTLTSDLIWISLQLAISLMIMKFNCDVCFTCDVEGVLSRNEGLADASEAVRDVSGRASRLLNGNITPRTFCIILCLFTASQ